MQQPQEQSIHIEDVREKDIETHLERIKNEFREGFKFLRKYPKTVTMFGSSQISPESPVYKKASELASRITKETSYAVLTGGGHGVMEAINKSVFEAGGQSLGFNISLPHNHESPNQFRTDSIKFTYFFARKAMMTFTAEAFIFLPGGFGTFDELFSILTLIQTGKIPKIPVILYDSLYWNDVVQLLKTTMFERFKTIKEDDLKLFTVTDSADEVIDIIKKAPVSDWWRNLN